jgi:hypothetical protein
VSIDIGLHLNRTARLEQVHFPSARESDLFGTLKIHDEGGSFTLFICPHRAESAGVEFLDALIAQAESLKHWLLFGDDLPLEPKEVPAEGGERVAQWYSCTDERTQTHLWSAQVPVGEAHGVTVHLQCPEHQEKESESANA